jgi:hypothetical protein
MWESPCSPSYALLFACRPRPSLPLLEQLHPPVSASLMRRVVSYSCGDIPFARLTMLNEEHYQEEGYPHTWNEEIIDVLDTFGYRDPGHRSVRSLLIRHELWYVL